MRGMAVLLFISLFSVGCVVPGKNYSISEVENIWATSSLGKSMSRTETIKYNIDYNSALELVIKGAEECFNFTRETQGNYSTKTAASKMDYYHEFEALSETESLIGVKRHAYALVTFQDGYSAIARLKHVGKNAMDVRYIRPVASGKGFVAQLDSWLKTGKIKCGKVD